MKDFKDSTRAKYGDFDFGAAKTAVKPHMRMVPMRKQTSAPIARIPKAEGGAVADVHKHEKHLHKGEPMTKLAKGGMAFRKPLVGC